mmetsp:Transcript_59519/g.181683  ORF Transcript_59519/g.181683 Transcript_59519/m.181683 type:complete len:666 (+) Transcript_59519:2668-4665(+)
MVQQAAQVHHEQQGEDEQEDEEDDQENAKLLHRLEDRLHDHFQRLGALDHAQRSERAQDAQRPQKGRPLGEQHRDDGHQHDDPVQPIPPIVEVGILPPKERECEQLHEHFEDEDPHEDGVRGPHHHDQRVVGCGERIVEHHPQRRHEDADEDEGVEHRVSGLLRGFFTVFGPVLGRFRGPVLGPLRVRILLDAEDPEVQEPQRGPPDRVRGAQDEPGVILGPGGAGARDDIGVDELRGVRVVLPARGDGLIFWCRSLGGVGDLAGQVVRQRLLARPRLVRERLDGGATARRRFFHNVVRHRPHVRLVFGRLPQQRRLPRHHLGLLLNLHLALVLVELRQEHAQKQAQEQDLPEEQEDQVEEPEAPALPHACVHDGVPILSSHHLEDRHEAPTKIVEMGSWYAILAVVHRVRADPRERAGVLWAPRYVVVLAVDPRNQRVERVGVLKLKRVGEKVHRHQREDVKDEEEQHQPILQRLGGRDHRLQQDLQRRRARRELVQHAEQSQRPQGLQAPGLAARHVNHLLDDGDDDDQAVEGRGRVFEVAAQASSDELDDHLEHEDHQEPPGDAVLGDLDGDDGRVGVQHHRDDVARDDERDEVREIFVFGQGLAHPHGGDVQPQRRLLELVAPRQRKRLRLFVPLLLLLLVFLLLSLEVIARLVHHGKGDV